MQPTTKEGLPMPKKTKVSSEVLQLAMEAAEKAKTSDDLRMAQAVLIPGLLDIPDRITGRIIGRSRGTVVQLRKKFSTFKRSQERNWGGRRSGYMTVEQERQFLSQFLEQASHGGILVVSEIQRAFEALVGRKVAQSTIYRMLDRHDWRTIIPRPRHPNSNTEAQEGFKKTPENSS
jgi:transposase